MYYKDHGPPHVHVEHQTQTAVFDFDGSMIQGKITSRTAIKLVMEWINLHRVELEENWKRIEEGRQLELIAPLD